MANFVGDTFGLGYINEQQVENFLNRNFQNWPESFTYGYSSGGTTPTSISTVIRTDFSNETASNPGNNMPGGVSSQGGTGSDAYGYFGGGYNASTVAITSIFRLDFSNETISDPGTKISLARSTIATVKSDNYGYFGGGNITSKKTVEHFSTIDRIDFKTEAVTSLTATLPIAIDSAAGVSNPDGTYGYFGGGQIPGFVSTITRLDFSNDTISGPGNNFPTTRCDTGATSNRMYGYFCNGFSPPYINTVSRLDFSTEIISDPGKNMPTLRSGLDAVSSSTSGYFCGGFDGSSNVSEIVRLDYTTEVTTNLTSVLPVGRTSAAGTSAGSIFLKGNTNYGYFSGGFNGAFISSIQRLDFSNETFSSPGKNISWGSENMSGFYSSSYGYFTGGSTNAPAFFSNIDRVDFSNETVNSPSTKLPRAIERHSSIQSNRTNYGYFAGGSTVSGIYVSSIIRMNFSDETLNESPSRILPSERRETAATSSNLYGYFAGGVTPASIGISDLVRLDFATEVISIPTNKLSQITILFAATSNDYYGYFGGGESSGSPSFINVINRLDFNTETVSGPPNDLLELKSRHASSSNNHYGFYVAGVNGVAIIATTNRMDFATEIVSNPGRSNYPIANNRFASVNTVN